MIELFKPYSSVIDGNKFDIGELYSANREEWIVQEKVRGAQFSLWITKDRILGANRTRFLMDREPYFNWKEIRTKLTPGLKAIRKRTSARLLTIYGEIFGGEYEHEQVEQCSAAIRLPRGVYYAPHNDWYAFDMVIDGMWQDQWFMYEIFDTLHVPYAYELFRGDLSGCFKHSCDFSSGIHELFNLPKIEGNHCGGIIIRPIRPVLEGGRRLLFKKEANRWNNVRIKSETIQTRTGATNYREIDRA